MNPVRYLNHWSSKLKISCPSCEAKYSIGDEKVQNRLAKIRCRKCGADIVIDGRVEPPSISLAGAENAGAPVAGGAAAGPQPEFTVDFAENDQRTLSLPDIVAAYNSGRVTAETYVWAEGMSDWTPLGQVQSIVAALNEAATRAPARAATAQSSAPRATSVSKASTGYLSRGRQPKAQVAIYLEKSRVRAARKMWPQRKAATTLSLHR